MIFDPSTAAVFDLQQIARLAVAMAPGMSPAIRRAHNFAQTASLGVVLNQLSGSVGQFLENQPIIIDVKCVDAPDRIRDDKSFIVPSPVSGNKLSEDRSGHQSGGAKLV